MPLVQVFLLTYNRPDFIVDSLTSILNQNFIDFQVIVSDNSTDKRTEKVVQTFSNVNLKYIRRFPSQKPLEHFATVLSEVESKYFMIFHDDDVMEPDCLNTLSLLLDTDSCVAAVGGNASIFWDKSKINVGKFISSKKTQLKFSIIEDLAKAYLTFGDLAPFPSYMYRTSMVKGVKLLGEEGGKYADVAFLLKILKKGEILWTRVCVMRYRKHSSQDSQYSDIKDMRRLINFLVTTTKFKKGNYEIRYYRFKSWAGRIKKEFLKTRGRIQSKRLRKIYCAIFQFSPFDIFLRLMIWRIYFFVKKD
jgi:GT2 family glycosyltransferase